MRLTVPISSPGNACHVPGAVGAISQQSASEHTVRVPVGRVADTSASQEATSAESIANTTLGTARRVRYRPLQGKYHTPYNFIQLVCVLPSAFM